MNNKIDIISPDAIKSRILKVRERCVIIDSDLAMMYGVETKNLKRAVRMNIERFPEDFMFVLSKDEYDSLRCNFFTLKNGRGQHSKYLPYAFTREGIAMLSGLLRTPIAVQVNINIMRAFFQMQQALVLLSETSLQIEKMSNPPKPPPFRQRSWRTPQKKQTYTQTKCVAPRPRTSGS